MLLIVEEKCSFFTFFIVHCSSRPIQIYWAKGDAMIRHGGPVALGTAVGSFADTSATVTKKGSLRIKRLTFADAGMYTCLGEW